VPLLVLTAVDYVLWDWSIADGRDIVSLVAGLTLLPLAAVSLGGFLLAGARLLRFLLGSSSSHVRARAHGANSAEQPPHASAADSNSSSSRLAA
jgi:hypothetical protein